MRPESRCRPSAWGWWLLNAADVAVTCVSSPTPASTGRRSASAFLSTGSLRNQPGVPDPSLAIVAKRTAELRPALALGPLARDCSHSPPARAAGSCAREMQPCGLPWPVVRPAPGSGYCHGVVSTHATLGAAALDLAPRRPCRAFPSRPLRRSSRWAAARNLRRYAAAATAAEPVIAAPFRLDAGRRFLSRLPCRGGRRSDPGVREIPSSSRLDFPHYTKDFGCRTTLPSRPGDLQC